VNTKCIPASAKKPRKKEESNKIVATIAKLKVPLNLVNAYPGGKLLQKVRSSNWH
jgi:hypothetical protein